MARSPRTPTATLGGHRRVRASRKSAPRRMPQAPAMQNVPALTASALRRERAGTPRPHRFRPGTRAIMEIRKYQRSTTLLLRRLPFVRLVREITQAFHHSMRYESAFHKAGKSSGFNVRIFQYVVLTCVTQYAWFVAALCIDGALMLSKRCK